MYTYVLSFSCLLLIMPNLGELIFNLDEPLKSDIRRFEKCMIKSVKQKLRCVYNDVCLQENILPQYSELNLHDKATNEEDFTYEFRRKQVQRQFGFEWCNQIFECGAKLPCIVNAV